MQKIIKIIMAVVLASLFLCSCSQEYPEITCSWIQEIHFPSSDVARKDAATLDGQLAGFRYLPIIKDTSFPVSVKSAENGNWETYNAFSIVFLFYKKLKGKGMIAHFLIEKDVKGEKRTRCYFMRTENPCEAFKYCF